MLLCPELIIGIREMARVRNIGQTTITRYSGQRSGPFAFGNIDLNAAKRATAHHDSEGLLLTEVAQRLPIDAKGANEWRRRHQSQGSSLQSPAVRTCGPYGHKSVGRA
jgi:hypothetical protein